MRFCIEDQLPEQTQEETIIFCDGAGSQRYRTGVDLELSHWHPNRTAKRFAADSSTEICMKFAASGESPDGYALVVNNHVDVDGILSVFVVLEPELSLRHRDTLVQAAEMGDFWGWGERSAQVLFQALVQGIARQIESGANADAIYQHGFDIVRAVLGGSEPADVGPGLSGLAACVKRIRSGEITRTLQHERFVHYALPRAKSESDLRTALRLLPFNTPLSDRIALLPHARALFDRERIVLQSVESEQGWYYDLCYPGYSWADTASLWRPPGVVRQETHETDDLQWPPLDEAVAALAADEKGDGSWTCAKEFSPFQALEGRGFPVVLAFMDGGQPAASRTPPEIVAQRLAPAFKGS